MFGLIAFIVFFIPTTETHTISATTLSDSTSFFFFFLNSRSFPLISYNLSSQPNYARFLVLPHHYCAKNTVLVIYMSHCESDLLFQLGCCYYTLIDVCCSSKRYYSKKAQAGLNHCHSGFTLHKLTKVVYGWIKKQKKPLNWLTESLFISIWCFMCLTLGEIV